MMQKNIVNLNNSKETENPLDSFPSDIPVLFENAFKPIIDYITNVKVYYGIYKNSDNQSILELFTVNNAKSIDQFKREIRLILDHILYNITQSLLNHPLSIRISSYQHIVDSLYNLKESIGIYQYENYDYENDKYIEFKCFTNIVWETYDIKKKYGKANRNYTLDEYEYITLNDVYIYEALEPYVNAWLNIVDKLEEKVSYILYYYEFQNYNLEKSHLKWDKTDTDLIELLVALHETGSVTNNNKNLSRKDLFVFFATLFNIKLKDYETKSLRAVNRKREQAVFLKKLEQSYIDYCKRTAK